MISWRCLRLIPLLLPLMAGGCATAPRTTERSPIDSTVFRGEWFDYYNRGMRRLQKGDNDGAESDLRRAVGLKFGAPDSHAARAYGVHFQSFYPHRELGFLALVRGDDAGALGELEASYRAAPSSRGAFLLNQARRRRIEREALDHSPPEFTALNITDGSCTRERRLMVKGTVNDDTAVESVVVNGRPVYVELAEPKVAFESALELRPGANHVRTTATDLAGRVRDLDYTITVDEQGPLLSLSEVRLEGTGAARRFWLKGEASDPSNLAQVHVGGTAVPAGQRRVSLEGWFPLAPGQDRLPYRLEDGCGNVSRGAIPLPAAAGARTGRSEAVRPPQRARLASVSAPNALLDAVAVAAQVPTTIDLGALKDGDRVYLDDFYIDGAAENRAGIKRIECTPAGATAPFQIYPDAAENLPARIDTQVRFSYLARMPREGTFEYTLRVVNTRDEEEKRTLALVRVASSGRRLDRRLSLAVYDSTACAFPCDDPIFPAELKTSFLRQVQLVDRFTRPLEREHLADIATEWMIAGIPQGTPDLLADLKKLRSADLLLYYRVEWATPGAEVFLDIYDVRTALLISTLDVYCNNLTTATELPAIGLYTKLYHTFPLAEGRVIRTERGKVYTTLTLLDKLRRGDTVFVLRKGEPVVEDGVNYGCPESSVGRLAVTEAHAGFSIGEVEKLEGVEKVQKGDIVLTK